MGREWFLIIAPRSFTKRLLMLQSQKPLANTHLLFHETLPRDGCWQLGGEA